MLAKTLPLRLSPATPFMFRRTLPLLAFLTFLFAGTAAQAAPLAENETIELPCGHLVKILSVSKVEYSKGVMALMVRYQTSLSIDQRKALSDEVDDFWKLAVKDVEHYGYDEAIISSNEVPKGIILTSSRIGSGNPPSIRQYADCGTTPTAPP